MHNPDNHLKILQVSTLDIAGGAEKIAWNLFQSYRLRGHRSWLAVGYKRSEEPDVLQIPNENYRNRWVRAWHGSSQRLQPLVGKVRGVGRVQGLLQKIADPLRWWEKVQGHEDFGFPGTCRLLELTPELPTIVHCHNLHDAYFDLRVLPWLSSQAPTILTLHDAWLLSGHCAHSFDCERWKIGCGHCPDLTIYPSIHRDATADNWQQKQKILARSRLYIATPSQWLMEKVKQSMLTPSIVEARVIHNGVDLTVFQPANCRSVRAVLGIPQDTIMLLLTANGIRRNMWKDYDTLRSSVARVAEHMDGQRVLCVALGEDLPMERVGRAELRFVPYQKDPDVVARYYQAADVYVHAAKVDTFPNTVLEALACGTPVVATAVGGIPEQITDGETGILVPQSDVTAMATAIWRLIADVSLRQKMGNAAAEHARRFFGLDRQVNSFLSWYEDVQRDWLEWKTHELSRGH